MQPGQEEVNLKRKLAEKRVSKGLKETTLETYRLEQDHAEDRLGGQYETKVISGLLTRASRAIRAVLGRGRKPLA